MRRCSGRADTRNHRRTQMLRPATHHAVARAGALRQLVLRLQRLRGATRQRRSRLQRPRAANGAFWAKGHAALRTERCARDRARTACRAQRASSTERRSTEMAARAGRRSRRALRRCQPTREQDVGAASAQPRTRRCAPARSCEHRTAPAAGAVPAPAACIAASVAGAIRQRRRSHRRGARRQRRQALTEHAAVDAGGSGRATEPATWRSAARRPAGAAGVACFLRGVVFARLSIPVFVSPHPLHREQRRQQRSIGPHAPITTSLLSSVAVRSTTHAAPAAGLPPHASAYARLRRPGGAAAPTPLTLRARRRLRAAAANHPRSATAAALEAAMARCIISLSSSSSQASPPNSALSAAAA